MVENKTGMVYWTPSFDDAGLYYITFKVESGTFSSRRILPFIIVDTDRAASLVNEKKEPMETLPEIKGAETKAIEFKIPVLDLDGDPVKVGCARDCPKGLIVDEAGSVIQWTPEYGQEGSYNPVFYAESRPVSRQITLRGVDPAADLDQIRSQVEKETIDRTKALTVEFSLSFKIEHTDRPAELQSAPTETLSVRETETLEFQVVALDPDGVGIIYTCKDCPSGMSINQTTGRLTWTPTFEQAGDYIVNIQFRAKDAPESKNQEVPVRVLVIDRNQPPRITQILYNDKVLLPEDVIEISEVQRALVTIHVVDPDDKDQMDYTLSQESAALGAIAYKKTRRSGELMWIPSYEDGAIGGKDHEINIKISDGKDDVWGKIKFKVNHVNRTPKWNDIPLTQVVDAGKVLSMNITATDPDIEDKSSLRYSCTAGCADKGATLNYVTGVFSWLPDYSMYTPPGTSHEFTFQADDKEGAANSIITRKLNVTVNRIDTQPKFSQMEPIQGMELQPVKFSVKAIDTDGDSVTYSCDNKPTGMTLDPQTGEVNWTPDIPAAANCIAAASPPGPAPMIATDWSEEGRIEWLEL
jgi:hypothetical protein